MNKAEQIGENIRRLRKAKGLTQKRLGEETGYTQSAVYTWEKGINIPPVLAIEKIARALNVKFSSIVGDWDEDG